MGPERSVVPFLKASRPHKEAVSPGGDISAVTQERKEESTNEEERSRETTAVGGACAPTSGASRPSSSSNGLGHHGEPARPEESEVREPRGEEIENEEEHETGALARLVRAPRTPSQSERELHEALHLPHAEWCGYCARGRGRNKPHSSRKNEKPPRVSTEVVDYPWEGQTKERSEEEKGVPKISLDYFFLVADKMRRITRNSADKMSTKQLRQNLKTA